MNTKDLIRLGVPVGAPVKLAHEFIQNFIAQGNDGAQLEAEIFNIVANPTAFFADELRAPLARAIYRPASTPRAELAPWRQWGEAEGRRPRPPRPRSPGRRAVFPRAGGRVGRRGGRQRLPPHRATVPV